MESTVESADLRPGVAEVDVGDAVAETVDGLGDFAEVGGLSGGGTFEVEGAELAADFGDEALLEAGLGAAGDGGKVDEVVADGKDLEEGGAGVFGFAQEEVEDGIRLGVGEIAPAVGHGAIGYIKEGLEEVAAVRVFGEGAADEEEEGVGALKAAAEVKEAPAVAAGHVFHDHTGKGGEAADEAVEEEQGVVEFLEVAFGGEFLLEFGKDAPGVEGEAVADAPSGSPEVGDAADEPGGVVFLEKDVEDFPVVFFEEERGFGGLFQNLQRDEKPHEEAGRDRVFEGEFVGELRNQDAHDADEGLGAFGVTAEPEEVVGNAAGEFCAGAGGGPGLDAGGEEGLVQDGAIREDPGVLTAAAGLHGDDRDVRRDGDAGEAAGHDDEAVPGGGQVGAEGDRAGDEFAAVPDGGFGEGDFFLTDEVLWGFADALDKGGLVLGAEGGGEDRIAAFVRKSAFDEEGVEAGEDVLALFAVAAPPGGGVGNEDFLAKETAAEGGEEGEQGRGFGEAGTDRIGDADIAGAHGFKQAGDAEEGILTEFQGIAEAIVHAAEDDIDLLEPLKGFDKDLAVAHGEVAAFHEGEAEITAEVGVLEVGFVERTGGEQDDAGAFAPDVIRGDAVEVIAEDAVEIGEALDLEIADVIRQGAGQDDAVFQDITGTGGSLGAVRKTPPTAIRPAGEVHGVKVQPGVFRGADPVAGELIAGIAQHDAWGQGPFLEQALGAVEIGQDGIEQPGALDQALFQGGPFVRGDDEGHGVEFPGPVHPAGVTVDIISDAIFRDGSPRLIRAGGQASRAEAVQRGGQMLVMGPQSAVCRDHFIPDPVGF